MFGLYQKVTLVLLDIPPAKKALEGVKMELDDGAFPLCHEIIATTDANEGFKDVDVALLVGAKPRGPGMERGDLLQANAKIFEAQGKVLDKVAKKSVKVCVVGNPANTNALIASKFAPSIPAENFTALTRLDENRAVTQIAQRVGCSIEQVKNVHIWGNHSATQYPSVQHATIVDYPSKGFTDTVSSVVGDDAWLKGDFLTTVQKRGAAIIQARKLSSAASAANAVCDHMHDWWYGTKEGEAVSMGVISNGNPYGIKEGINYSFPVTIKNGQWKIVEGYKVCDFSREKMQKTEKELLDERKMALGI